MVAAVQVRIAPQWMTNTNQQVRARQLWGSDVYTEDSDLVAALMHAGFYSISLPAAPPSVHLPPPLVPVRVGLRGCTSVCLLGLHAARHAARLPDSG